MDNKLSSIFVLIFILFISLISVWLNHEVKKELTEKEKRLNGAADFYLKNFVSNHINKNGTIKYKIEGEKMQSFKFSEKTLIVKPRFINYKESKAVSLITGNSGEITNMGDEITIMENVTLVRLPNKTKKKMTLYTNELNIIPSKDIVFSRKPVKIVQEPNIEIDGIGMQYDKKENTIKLLRDVKVLYENIQN